MNDIFSYILQNISYSGHVTNVQIKLNSLKVKQNRVGMLIIMQKDHRLAMSLYYEQRINTENIKLGFYEHTIR